MTIVNGFFGLIMPGWQGFSNLASPLGLLPEKEQLP